MCSRRELSSRAVRRPPPLRDHRPDLGAADELVVAATKAMIRP